jgi:hypothetical protein
MKIEFTETRTVQDGSGTTFEAGKVYDLPPESADHWKRRGVAKDAPEGATAEDRPTDSATAATRAEQKRLADERRTNNKKQQPGLALDSKNASPTEPASAKVGEAKAGSNPT